ncbi:MAG: carboxylating nicotinate-nucleotide diphosphorylase [Bacteroidia bacterium]
MIAQELAHLQPDLDNFIKNALYEDVRDGDHSSLACIDPEARSKARLFIKDNGILAGMSLAEYIFAHVAPTTVFTPQMEDGQAIKKGDIAFEIEGEIQKILMLERLVLNCMQRMSGIATQTREMTTRIADLDTKLLDTRKTTPCIRFLEKWAVRIGGGVNHRFGLFDMIMLKDNHIDGAGGIEKAIRATHQYLEVKNLELRIEVETRNLDEVEQVLSVGGIDRIMLDNFDIATLTQAVKLIGGKYETEASGGITVDTLREYALTGVNFISSSAMTHSVKSLDLSLKLVK